MRRPKGFTLIELMIVIAIIAMLTAIAAVNYQKYLRKAKMTRAEGDIAQIENALAMFEADHGSYPKDDPRDHEIDPSLKPYDDGNDSPNDADNELDPKEWVRLLTTRCKDEVSGNQYGPYLPKGLPLDPWGNEYQYFRRLTGDESMEDVGFTKAGQHYQLYEFGSPYANEDRVGCGIELDTTKGEDAELIWTPPPADKNATTQNKGLLPYYVFSLGQNGVPGGDKDNGFGDDIVGWDSERRYRRAYE